MPSPEHDAVVQFLTAYGVADQVDTPVAEQRQAYEAAGAAYPLDPAVTVTPVTIPGPAGAPDVTAEWVDAPDSDPDRAVLYLHGGGYVIGGCATHRELASRISVAAGVRVLLPEYRLAPESPFPAALDDALAAWAHLESTGVGPAGTVVAGDSAGGGLTLAALLRRRDEGLALPAAAICLSPWTDLALGGDTLDAPGIGDPIVSRVFLETMAAHYLAGHDARDPLASPLFGDLAGLPPILLQVGTAEVLLDDSRRFARAASDAGVNMTLHEFDGLIHVFQAFAALAPEAREALAEIGAFARAATGVAAR